MALTYYIRSWDPRSTYPTNPQEGDICYTITLDQTWAPVGGVKKDNIVKEEIYQSGAWVEQGGGGGGPEVVTVVEGTFATTENHGVYMADINASVQVDRTEVPDALDIEFDGETYHIDMWYTWESSGKAWGAPFTGSGFSWADYPFALTMDGTGYWILFCQTSGSHDLNVTFTRESASYETALVEVNLSSVGGGVLAIPFLESGNGDLTGYFQIASGQSGTLNFSVLMKDGYSCGAYISSSGTVTPTGSVYVDAIDGGYSIEVEGNGTLNISG